MSPSTAPTVSVVIPTYNAASLLPEAVESVLAQTYRDLEIVVVDDGSTDRTPQVMADYGDPVRYIRKENEGSASARNRGIRAARGEYIAFLDADDRWRPTKLEKQMRAHRADPSLAWSYTGADLVDADTGAIRARKTQLRTRHEGDVLRNLILGSFVTPSATVVQRRVFDEVGTFDESSLHRISEDWDLWLRIAAHYPIRFIDEPLVENRQHTDRKTKTMDLDAALESRMAIIDKAVARTPERLGDLHHLARADLYVRIGRKWINRENRVRAREMFNAALQEKPTHWRAWMYGSLLFVPRPVLKILGAVRRVYRQVLRRALSLR
jgi:glycosyltransferase involved in cell wall biosynthesis